MSAPSTGTMRRPDACGVTGQLEVAAALVEVLDEPPESPLDDEDVEDDEDESVVCDDPVDDSDEPAELSEEPSLADVSVVLSPLLSEASLLAEAVLDPEPLSVL